MLKTPSIPGVNAAGVYARTVYWSSGTENTDTFDGESGKVNNTLKRTDRNLSFGSRSGSLKKTGMDHGVHCARIND
jgi:hypothetical protein